MSFRDAFKTAGDIRAAAFYICHPEHAPTLVDPSELHDSICKALPGPSETPVSVSRHALELKEALEAALLFVERYSDVVDGDYGVPEPNEAMRLAAMIQAALDIADGGSLA